MRLSKNLLKSIKALQQKKFRQEESLFVVEGDKIAQEVLATKHPFSVKYIIALDQWLEDHPELLLQQNAIIYEVSEKELSRISGLKTPNQVLLVLEQRSEPWPELLDGQLALVLEDIQNPGNLGTIIRIADWFGIQHIFCSLDCVEHYNPKVIQASMGSFLRIQLHYTKLDILFAHYPKLPRYGALLEGTPVMSGDFDPSGFLLIGNESKGLSLEAQDFLTQAITIPRYGQAESLNAAIATGILCAAFRRKTV